MDLKTVKCAHCRHFVETWVEADRQLCVCPVCGDAPVDFDDLHGTVTDYDTELTAKKVELVVQGAFTKANVLKARDDILKRGKYRFFIDTEDDA